MAQPFYVRKTELKIGPRKGETVYSAQAYYYGTITTKEVAAQIAQESALTQADVIGVIERLGYFCQSHTQLGYKVKLDGIGVFYNEIITTKSVNTAAEVTAKLIKSVRPAFSPEYTIVNSSFRYALLPEKVELTKIDFKGGTVTVSDEDTPSDGNSSAGGDSSSGDDTSSSTNPPSPDTGGSDGDDSMD